MSAQTAPKTCRDLARGAPGFGVSYRGLAGIDDYGLKVVIPRGHTAWGAASIAPFHGFTIFFDRHKTDSCIVFEIHRKVDLGDPPVVRKNARPTAVRVGNVEGIREEFTGILNGMELRNVLMSFSTHRGRETLEGSIWFVAPSKDYGRYAPVFNSLVASIRLDANPRQP